MRIPTLLVFYFVNTLLYINLAFVPYSFVILLRCRFVLLQIFLETALKKMSGSPQLTLFIVATYIFCSTESTLLDNKIQSDSGPTPCTCGIFLSGQFKKGSKDQPKGVPVLTQEMDTPFMNNAIGNRQCINKCLELIVKHLPKSGDIICSTIDRDCHKERAYLFIQNYGPLWVNTNMSAGREFCCKDNQSYKCK